MSTLNTYATLDALRARFAVASTDTADDVRFLAKLRAASAQIERAAGRIFAPIVATRAFDWRNDHTLLFRTEDLLSLTALINGDGSTIDPAAIIQLGGVGGAIYGVELNLTKAFFVYLLTKTRALSVSGVWGWHDDYANAWKPSGDVVSVFSMTAADTTVTVNSVTSADGWGLAPRFQVGQLISIDSEYMQVTAVSSGTSTLGVIRGTNGTFAAVHIIGTPITVYVPPIDVSEIALRWAAWLIKQEDAGEYGQTLELGIGGAHVPPGVPPDLLAALDGLRKVGGAV